MRLLSILSALVVAFAIPRIRDWILVRVLGYAWLKISQRERIEAAREARNADRRERLREALGVPRR